MEESESGNYVFTDYIYEGNSSFDLGEIFDFVTSSILEYIKIIKDFAINYQDTWVNSLMSVSVFFILLIFILKFKMKRIAMQEGIKFAPYTNIGVSGEYKNERWQRILSHIEMESPSEWKMAIILADNILDEMTIKSGYRGETLGERLRSVEKSDFNTIDKAWEAHKIRNIIAHDDSAYQMTHREAQRIIGLYADIFKEFRFI